MSKTIVRNSLDRRARVPSTNLTGEERAHETQERQCAKWNKDVLDLSHAYKLGLKNQSEQCYGVSNSISASSWRWKLSFFSVVQIAVEPNLWKGWNGIKSRSSKHPAVGDEKKVFKKMDYGLVPFTRAGSLTVQYLSLCHAFAFQHLLNSRSTNPCLSPNQVLTFVSVACQY